MSNDAGDPSAHPPSRLQSMVSSVVERIKGKPAGGMEIGKRDLAVFFSRIPDIKGLAPWIYDALARLVVQRACDPGEPILDPPGPDGSPLSFILVGHVQITALDPSERSCSRVAGMSDTFGEAAVVRWADGVAPPPPEFLARSLDRSILLELRAKDFPAVFGDPTREPATQKERDQRAALDKIRTAHDIDEQAPALVAALAKQPGLANASPSTLRRLLEGAEIKKDRCLWKRGDDPQGFYLLPGPNGQFLYRDGSQVVATAPAPSVAGLMELAEHKRLGHDVEQDVDQPGAPPAVYIPLSTLFALFKYDDDFRRVVLLALPPAARKRWSAEAEGPKIFAMCAAPRVGETPSLRRLTDLLAETIARHTYDRVLVLHALPAGATPREDTLRLTPEKLPGARYKPIEGSVEVVHVWDAVPVDGLEACLEKHRKRHTDLDVILVETTACVHSQDPVLNAPVDKPPSHKIIYVIDRLDFVYEPKLVIRGFDFVFAALLRPPDEPPGIGFTAFRMWDRMWTSVGAFAGGVKELASVTAANVAAAGSHFARTFANPQAWDSGDTRPAWPVGAVRLEHLSDLPDAAPAGADEARPGVDALSPEAKESLRRWARQITSRRVGVALGGGASYGLVHVPLLTRLWSEPVGAGAEQDAPVPIDFVTGTSVGSTMGTYLCAVPRYPLVQTSVQVGTDGDGQPITNEVGVPQGLALGQAHFVYMSLIGSLSFINSFFFQLALWLDVGGVALESAPVPFFPVVTDAWSGAEWNLRAGSFAHGTRASGSLPPFFGPTVIGTRRYLDGGLSANVPVLALETEGARIILASNPIADVKQLPGYHDGFQIPYVSSIVREAQILPRVRDVFRMVPLLARAIGETQTGLATVTYRPTFDDSQLFPKVNLVWTKVPPFFTLEVASSPAYGSPSLNEAVQQFANEWRKLLHRAPSPVRIGKDRRSVLVDGSIRFVEGEAVIAPASMPLLEALAQFLRHDPGLGTLLVRVDSPLAGQRQQAIIVALERFGVDRSRLQAYDGKLDVQLPAGSETPAVGFALKEATEAAALADEQALRLDAERRLHAASLLLAAATPDVAADADLAAMLAIEAGVRTGTLDADHLLRVNLARRGVEIARFPAEAPTGGQPPQIEVLAVSPAGGLVALGARDGKLHVRRVRDDAASPFALAFEVDHHGTNDQAVTAAAFSPDGRLCASTGLDSKLRISQVPQDGAATTAPLWKADETSFGTEWDHLPLAFSSNGQRLVGGPKRMPAVWTLDVEKGTLTVARLNVGTKVLAAALSPDGASVATGEADGTLTIWHAASGEPVKPALIAGGGAPVSALAWSADGARLAVVTGADVRIFTVADGSAVWLRGHAGRVEAIAFRADGERLLSASRDGTARLWDEKGTLLGVLVDPQHKPVLGAAWHPKRADVVATWNGTGAALVWDVARTVPHSRLTGHTAVIAAAAWDPESGRFVTASRDGTARLWDPELDASRHHRCASGYEITTAEWHPTDPTRAVIACSDGTVTIWDPSGQGKLGPHEIFGDERPPPLAYAAWSPDGRWLAAARAGDGRLRVLAVPPSGSDAWLDRLDHTGAPGGPRQMAEQQCDMVAWSPDSRYLAVMHYERLEVWDVGDGGAAPRLIAELPPSYGGGEALRLSALAWHPRLPRLAVARWTMDEQTVRVLDVPSAPTNDWQPSFQLMHGEGVWSLAFTHDGAQLVTGANDKLVRVFDLPATPGASVATLQPSFRVQMNDQVLAVACSPKDGLFAAGDSQGTVAIFDASEKPSALGDSLIASPEAGNAAIHDLSWSRDGTWVVAASESALLWQREPGPVREGMFVLAARVGGREDRTASVALAPDGAAMITVNEAGIARAEPVSRASLLAAVGTRLHRRTMTDDEWQRYMGALPAQPSWPRPADDPPLPPASLTPASAASPAAAADA